MKRVMAWSIGVLCLAAVAVTVFAADTSKTAAPEKRKESNPMVVMETSKGKITIELFADKAPKTVENFLSYVDEKFYDDVIFHRVIPNFMIQGGGFTKDMDQKKTHKPVENEARSDTPNDRGTLAMARTGEIHSATAQFFINLKDNDFLNHKNKTAQGYGYAVFGKVTEGMDVVDAIAKVATGRHGYHDDVPKEPVIITSVRRVEKKAE